MAKEPEQQDLFDWKPKKDSFKFSKLFKTLVRFEWFMDNFSKIAVIFLLTILLFLFILLVIFLITRLFDPIALLLFLVVVAIVILWRFPIWQIKELKEGDYKTPFEFEKKRDYLKLLDDTRKTIAQVLGGMFLLAGLILTLLTFESNKERQLSERYSEDIKLLKSENEMSIRKGGLYDLEKIARDSNKQHPIIMNFLIDYIKDRSKKITVPNTCVIQDQEQNDDILLAATVIVNRDRSYDIRNFILDLSKSLLNEAEFDEMNFESASFDKACLVKAHFQRATLNNAKFGGADLWGADLKDAKLYGADLFRVLNLEPAQIDVAYSDENTVVPPPLLEAKKSRLLAIRKEALESEKRLRGEVTPQGTK